MTDQDAKQQPSITQDNSLVEACYTMTLNEKRLLMLGMSRVNPMDFPRESKALRFTLKASDWTNNFKDENPYRAMKRAADSLLVRYVTLHPKTGVTQKISWFDSVEYHDDKSSVTVEFSRSIQVRLSGMLEQFTQLDLLSVSQLRSIYSVRLYELLTQFINSKDYREWRTRVINLDDFRWSMDAVKSYPKIYELKRRILTPALRELNRRSDLEVRCEDVKSGRTITGFRFHFREQDQRELFS